MPAKNNQITLHHQHIHQISCNLCSIFIDSISNLIISQKNIEFSITNSISICYRQFRSILQVEICFNFWFYIQMVHLRNSISVCKSVDQCTVMANSTNLTDSSISKSRHNNHHVFKNKKNPNSSKLPACVECQNAAVDIAILIIVLCACGFLLYPYMKFISVKFTQNVGVILCLVKEEVSIAPMVYGSLGFGILCSALATWGILMCTSKKCGNPNCRGLRKAAEFDIQLETEECVNKNSTSMVKDGVRKGLFELPRDHHRELEAELKKMAPFNGRAVLVFRARCGCSVGRMEVPGPKKPRKFKK